MRQSQLIENNYDMSRGNYEVNNCKCEYERIWYRNVWRKEKREVMHVGTRQWNHESIDCDGMGKRL